MIRIRFRVILYYYITFNMCTLVLNQVYKTAPQNIHEKLKTNKYSPYFIFSLHIDVIQCTRRKFNKILQCSMIRPKLSWNIMWEIFELISKKENFLQSNDRQDEERWYFNISLWHVSFKYTSVINLCTCTFKGTTPTWSLFQLSVASIYTYYRDVENNYHPKTNLNHKKVTRYGHRDYNNMLYLVQYEDEGF